MTQNHGGLLERFISYASSVIWQWTAGWMAMALFLAGVRNYCLPHSIKTACRAYRGFLLFPNYGAVKAYT
jgi:hypothetical protein